MTDNPCKTKLDHQLRLARIFKSTHGLCVHGVIDILTSDKIIEISEFKHYYRAIGGLSAYQISFPEHIKQVYFYGPDKNNFERLGETRLPALGIIYTDETMSDEEILNAHL